MKSIHHKEIQEFIWNRKGKPFGFALMKKKIHGYSWFGGGKYKEWIKSHYGLREIKQGGKVMLQKIPRQEKQQEED